MADKQIYYPLDKELNNKKIKILFYGSFIPLHGIDIILEAFSLMEKAGVDFEAKIIGTGQIYSKMKNLHEKLELKNVQMDGKLIDENKLAQEIREHDIILGIFGDSKKAIVTMYSEAIFEFFDEKDLITCDRKASVLCKNLINLIDNSNLLKSTAENGYRKFLEIYDKTSVDFENFIFKIDNKLEKK